MTTIRHFGPSALLVGVVAVVGCGGQGPDLGDVNGRVTLDGEPLVGATVMFLPAAGGRPATGRTDAEGRYVLRYTGTETGALIGEHEVQITTYEPPNPQGKGRPELVPPRYNAKSELRAQVDYGETTHDFDLTTK